MRTKNLHFSHFLTLLAISYAVCIQSQPAQGQCEIAEILDMNGQAFENFGNSLAISGNIVVVGVQNDDELGEKSGSAFIFRFDPITLQWSQDAKLLASDGKEYDKFGYAVAILDNLIFIGAIGTDDVGISSGSVYIFHYDGLNWVEEDKLFAAAEASGFGFGAAIAISGDRIIVGAPFVSDECIGCGAAFILRYNYEKSMWSNEGKVIASDAMNWVEGYDLFG